MNQNHHNFNFQDQSAQPDGMRRDWTMLFFHHCSYDGLRSDTCTGGSQWLRQRHRRGYCEQEQCAGQDAEIFKRGEILQLERRYRVETLNMPYVQRLALSHDRVMLVCLPHR
jgi:hypothetical protein